MRVASLGELQCQARGGQVAALGYCANNCDHYVIRCPTECAIGFHVRLDTDADTHDAATDTGLCLPVYNTETDRVTNSDAIAVSHCYLPGGSMLGKRINNASDHQEGHLIVEDNLALFPCFLNIFLAVCTSKRGMMWKYQDLARVD